MPQRRRTQDTAELLSTPEVAALGDVGTSERTARRWAAANGVALFGGRFAWSPDDVAEFILDLDRADDDDDDDDETDDEADGDELDDALDPRRQVGSPISEEELER